MQRFKYSILAAAGILVLAGVLTVAGPKRVMAALGYTPVRDITNPALQPFQITLSATDSFTTPAGKRLVIDHVSGIMDFVSGGPNNLALETTANGRLASHYLHTTFVSGSPPNVWYNVSDTGGIYADPNTNVSTSLNYSGSRGFENITISGHLVDLP